MWKGNRSESDRIRTCDGQTPNQVLYRCKAELRSRRGIYHYRICIDRNDYLPSDAEMLATLRF